jgi:hypothetical protein
LTAENCVRKWSGRTFGGERLNAALHRAPIPSFGLAMASRNAFSDNCVFCATVKKSKAVGIPAFSISL